jgi:hypothetical protein
VSLGTNRAVRMAIFDESDGADLSSFFFSDFLRRGQS